eukprot:Skav218658  [mRNA]  locus=scaffold365:806309:808862:- [translate_table: standard]
MWSGTTLSEVQEAVASAEAGDALAVSTAVGLKVSTGGASLAEAAEKAAEKRWETRDRGETTAIGQVSRGGPEEQSGAAPELIKEEPMRDPPW